MTAPTAGHAARRRVVRLPDGRTGVLLFVPHPHGSHHGGGAKAKVQLHAGAVLSVPVSDLELVEDQPAPRPPRRWQVPDSAAMRELQEGGGPRDAA